MSDERTMLPTAKRRQLARAEGRVAVSRQISAAAILFAASLSLTSMAPLGMFALTSVFNHAWSEPWIASEPSAALHATQFRDVIVVSGGLVLPVAAACFVIALLTRVAQVGFLWLPERVLPDARRIAPGGRISSLFSLGKLVELAQGLALLIVTLGVAGWIWWTKREQLMQLALGAPQVAGSAWWELLAGIAIPLSACVAVFAALDYAIQRYRFELSLQMTPEEVRAEIQAVQGNPQVAAGRREMQHRKLRVEKS